MTRTRNIGKIGCFSAAILAALVLAGCGGGSSKRPQPLPGQPGNTPPPEIERPDLIQPALNTIGERIKSHEARLEEIRAIENSPASMMVSPEKMGRLADCKTSLLDILTNYDALQKRLQRETNLDAAQNLANNMLQQVNRQDMQYLEGDCNRLVADLQKAETMSSRPAYQEPAYPPPAYPQSGYDQPGYGQPAAPPPAYPDYNEPGAASYPGAPAYGSAPAAPDPAIRQAFAAGDYTEVISLYNRNWGAAGEAAPSTTWQYGQALLKNYQTDEAQRALAGLDAQLERRGGGDPLAADVLRALGDIAFGAGRFDEAQRYYSREVNLPGSRSDAWSQRQLAALRDQSSATSYELSDYAALIRAWLAYVPGRDGSLPAEQAERFLQSYPASRLVANVNEIHRMARDQAEEWNRRSGGQAPASDRPGGSDNNLPPPTIEYPPETQPPASSGEYVGRPGQPSALAAAPLSAEQVAAREYALREQYERGRNQVASGRFDEAIQTFGALRGSSLDAEAREGLNDAAARAGESNRQRAAELYVQANQTADPEIRRRLLIQSRDLLRDIPRKYPQAGLDDKVAGNLATVEAALRPLEAPPAPQQPYGQSL